MTLGISQPLKNDLRKFFFNLCLIIQFYPFQRDELFSLLTTHSKNTVRSPLSEKCWSTLTILINEYYRNQIKLFEILLLAKSNVRIHLYFQKRIIELSTLDEADSYCTYI
jgi:hypothetical protein